MKRQPTTIIMMSLRDSELVHDHLLSSNRRNIEIEIPPKTSTTFLMSLSEDAA
ncbi:hypothetical protein [Roseivirga sp. E12]|uniref:hypothetical protein n=1 Tax=Roseivirga sp. E12 TaxID=2819237 RepID=UPI001ABC83DB|nr:hypothetical protein [Roseivirga sp. E12]MBO3698008.1 hypothetical protein [Roseivirga sp. E12]